jgi:hypothetical protein
MFGERICNDFRESAATSAGSPAGSPAALSKTEMLLRESASLGNGARLCGAEQHDRQRDV